MAKATRTEQEGTPGGRWWPLAACLSAAALALGWMWGASITVLDERYDCLLFLRGAESLLRGDWLGPYDSLTLARPPLYSLFLALNAWLGWRLHLTQQLLYLLAIGLLALALRRAGMSAGRAAWVFVLCTLHPVGLYTPTFVISEALYIPLSVLVLAGVVGALATLRQGRAALSAWVALLCLALAALWHTRPEGVWTAPFLALVGVVALWLCRGSRCALRAFSVLVLPAGAVLAGGALLAAQNQAHYGVHLVHELDDPNLRAAFNWLSRLAPQARRPHVPVTRAAMAAAYGVSPSFARLRPYLERQGPGQGWVKAGCGWMGICDELAGGWTAWAIREGVAELGLYSEPGQASRYYANVARELREACTQGRIPCSKNPTGSALAPPLTPADFPRLLGSAARLTAMTLRLDSLTATVLDSQQARGSEPVVQRYAAITHDVDWPWPERILALVPPHIAGYRLLQMGAAALIVLMLVTTSRRGTRAGPTSSRLLQVTLVIWAFVLSRLAAISYLDAMSFSAQLRYLALIYPALMALAVLAVPSPRFNDMEAFHEQT